MNLAGKGYFLRAKRGNLRQYNEEIINDLQTNQFPLLLGEGDLLGMIFLKRRGK